MPLVDAKCTNCGANLKVDSSKDAVICEFCGSAFVVEQAINNYNITNKVTNNINAQNVTWNCQEMCSQRIPKIMDRQISGSVMSQPS